MTDSKHLYFSCQIILKIEKKIILKIDFKYGKIMIKEMDINPAFYQFDFNRPIIIPRLFEWVFFSRDTRISFHHVHFAL